MSEGASGPQQHCGVGEMGGHLAVPAVPVQVPANRSWYQLHCRPSEESMGHVRYWWCLTVLNPCTSGFGHEPPSELR